MKTLKHFRHKMYKDIWQRLGVLNYKALPCGIFIMNSQRLNAFWERSKERTELFNSWMLHTEITLEEACGNSDGGLTTKAV